MGFQTWFECQPGPISVGLWSRFPRAYDKHSSSLAVIPAKRDVDGHFVDFSFVGQAVAADVGQELEAILIGVHGVIKTLSAPLKADKSLCTVEWFSATLVCLE